MTLEALLDGSGLGFVELPVSAAALLLGDLRLRLGFLQVRLEALDLFGGENAGIVRILVVLFVGGGKERGEFGEAEALGFDLGEQFWELALEDFGIGNELGTPAAGGNGFQVGFEVVDVAGECATNLVIGQERLSGELFGNAGEELTAELVDIGPCAVGMGRESFDVAAILIPP